MSDRQPQIERRAWLASVVRGVMLGGLTMLGLRLGVRAAQAGCFRSTESCGDCALLKAGCRLPRAAATTRHQGDRQP